MLVSPESLLQLYQACVVQGGLTHMCDGWCRQVAVALGSPGGLSPSRRPTQTHGCGKSFHNLVGGVAKSM